MSDMNQKNISIDKIFAAAIQIPKVKVDRTNFLTEQFNGTSYDVSAIADYGPVAAGVMSDELRRIATQLIMKRTGASSVAALVAGIPGGLAYAATIPADLVQFYAVIIRLAQEISYLYGADDFWTDAGENNENAIGKLILLTAVMYDIPSALPCLRLTLIKQGNSIPEAIGTQYKKAVSMKMAKTSANKSISKAVPLLGGLLSGSANVAEMLPMAQRLLTVCEQTAFSYTSEDIRNDLETVSRMATADEYAYQDVAASFTDKVRNNEAVQTSIAKGREIFNAFKSASADIIKEATSKMKDDYSGSTTADFSEEKEDN